MQDVEKTIVAIIARKAGIDASEISRETELESLNVDSVDRLEVVFEIEDAFHISLVLNTNGAADGATPMTVGEVVDLVTAELDKSDAASVSGA